MFKRAKEIKQAQRESFFLQEIAQLYRQITLDEPELFGLYINRVQLSSDGGTCIILFIAPGGIKEFEEKLKTIVLYKASLRTALAKISHGRYVPKLIFRYDESFEKQQKLDNYFDQLKKEGKL